MFFTSIIIIINNYYDKFGSTVMPALMIPYDTIHNYMYAQGLVWATGLKERQTGLSFLLLLTIINIHILTN